MVAHSQSLKISDEVPFSQDSTKIRITREWNKHFAKAQFDDKIEYALDRNFRIYEIGKHNTFSIERADNKYYDINTIVQMPNNDVLLIYTVCADSTGKLYNYLDVNRH